MQSTQMHWPKTNEVGYVNLWAAKALQVRVYMTKGDGARLYP